MKIREEYMNRLQERYATRAFDKKRTIKQEDIKYILKAGWLSPSSFGIEPWKLLVVESNSMKKKLQKACFNQSQISTSSIVVVVLARKGLRLEDGYVEPLLRREGDKYYESTLKENYSSYTSSLNDDQLFEYADKQCYLVSMNLMNAAIILNIDSCPVGGFEAEKVMQALKVNPSKYGVSLVVPFGYRVGKLGNKERRDFNDVVQFIDETN